MCTCMSTRMEIFLSQAWSDAVVGVGKLDVPGGGIINKIFVLEKGEIEFRGTPPPDDVTVSHSSPTCPESDERRGVLLKREVNQQNSMIVESILLLLFSDSFVK